VAVLDRPRHEGLIEEIRAAGAGTRLMLDGIEEAPRELTAFELVSELEPRDLHGIDKLAIEEKERAHANDAEREPGVA
jgi:hypothetical protein